MQKGGSRMNERIRRWVILGLALSLLVCAGLWSVAQENATPEDEEYRTVTAILSRMAGQLRLATTLATYAVLTPTRDDQRLYAQYIVNLLEGKGGEHYVPLPLPPDLAAAVRTWGLSTEGPGLIESGRVLSLSDSLKRIRTWMTPREQLLYAAKNITFLLVAAREESLQSLRSRNIEQAADHMRRAYAFAFTALGESTGINPGSVRFLLWQLGRPQG
jgi:hypothetical protein